jgi:diacylglycerol kinase family enzyme
LAEVRKAGRIEFHLKEAVDVMIDGEVVTLHCQTLDVLPGALSIVV